MKINFFYLFFLFLGTFSYADSYSSIKYHFSFTIPNGLIEIPKQKLDTRLRQLADSTGTKFVDYIAGYQEAGIQDFGYPNMLLQFHDLKGNKITWNDFIKSMGNLNFNDAINNGSYSTFVNNFNSTAPMIDANKRMIIYNSEVNVTGVGLLRIVTILFLGKNGIVQINLTIPKNKYNNYASAIINVINTFIFDYGYEYSE
jgi:hypothetical protein